MGGKTSNESKSKYNAKAYDRLYPFVPKGRKAEIQAIADAMGETLNEFIVKAIDERIEYLVSQNLKSLTMSKGDREKIRNLNKGSHSK